MVLWAQEEIYSERAKKAFNLPSKKSFTIPKTLKTQKQGCHDQLILGNALLTSEFFSS